MGDALKRSLSAKRRRTRRHASSEGGTGNEFVFEKKVALVTGAGSGMGLSAAQAFAAEGAAVALVDINESAVRIATERLVAAAIRHSYPLRCHQ